MSRDQRIIALVKTGKTFQQVADEMGLTRGTVAGVCHRNGVTSLNPQGWCGTPERCRHAAQVKWARPGARENQSRKMAEQWALKREARA